MSYLVLARKFRPQNFDEVLGQEHISQTLKNAITENRIAHAYLFSGPRGCGKTTMARILAKALNCKNGPAAEPCGVCENCLEISKSSNIDVFEIDGASNNGIDNIRELRENVKFAPSHSKYKIYIIDEAHQISTAAFNALLKTLEEPPAHVIFIMATTEQHKIPITILSRCQRYRFKLISSKEIASAIKNIGQKEGFEIDDEALNIVVSASGGSMRDALSLLDQAVSSNTGKITGEYIRSLLGLLPKEIINSVTQDLAKGDIEKILKTVKEISEEGYNILQFARDLRDHLREVMIYSVNPEIAEVSGEEKKVLETQKTLFTVARHVRMNNLLSKALEEMRWHDHPRILLEMYLLKMSEPYYNVGELINKISELEKNVKSAASSDDVPSDFSAKKKADFLNASAAGESLESADLLGIWQEIVSEISQKHPLTSQSLLKTIVKIISPSSIQAAVSNQFDKDGVLEFQEQISKLFLRKTGADIAMKVIIEKAEPQEPKIEEIAQTQSEEQPPSAAQYKVEEDLKETAKIAVPKHIEDIAKKFGGKAKKI
ncbi:DNA polymerase III subunit gamma/tau [Endomicrobium proavitum]|uniref:DNA polymerase III subunit gamma/tau n=1 Tax=Endomicrobium proavitum TaxID=1408281 RepID=A0A0G3WI33_9BACT|nr:DNA polymerase III subunit gamma/tau [Endomicrobium proavitum]AKL98351.1 DNA polymerase III subunit gamma/tau [Endomicrobium proavitum]